MITEIGIIAGDIWNYLEGQKSERSLSDMVKSIGKSRETILMGLGWLAREGHVAINLTESGLFAKLISR